MRRRQSSALATLFAIILTVLFIALAFVATPLLVLLIGMAVGYILELCTGDYVIKAFHAIGLTSAQVGDLPKIFGLLSLLAMTIRVGVSSAVRPPNDDE